MWGIREDGSIEWQKGIPTPIQNKLKELEDSISEGEGNLTEKVSQLQTQIDEINKRLMPLTETYDTIDNPEWLQVTVDQNDTILEGIKEDGTKYFPNQELLEKYNDPENRSEITIDNSKRILSYRDNNGIKHEEKLGINKIYDKNSNEIILATKEYVDNKTFDTSDIKLSELDGIEDHSLPNLFDKNNIRTYDSEFADKVFEKIGRKTAETGCYSNNIEAKEGDWFTRSDFGTGIVVALDENENVLGDIANASYQPTVQIIPSDPNKYDFSTIRYVVFVVMIDSIDNEIITKAKYVSDGAGDYITIPKLRIESVNVLKTTEVFFPSTSGRYYKLQINDRDSSNPTLNYIVQEGIPTSNLPEDFPYYECSGDFSEYLDGLVMCPIRNVADYLIELTPQNLVRRYLKKRVNCPRILKENNVWYYYGVDNELNSSTGKLNIYKADEETFSPVYENLGGGTNRNLLLEPHDCLVLSVNPLHYIYHDLKKILFLCQHQEHHLIGKIVLDIDKPSDHQHQ